MANHLPLSLMLLILTYSFLVTKVMFKKLLTQQIVQLH